MTNLSTVGELKKALAELPDNTKVFVVCTETQGQYEETCVFSYLTDARLVFENGMLGIASLEDIEFCKTKLKEETGNRPKHPLFY